MSPYISTKEFIDIFKLEILGWGMGGFLGYQLKIVYVLNTVTCILIRGKQREILPQMKKRWKKCNDRSRD